MVWKYRTSKLKWTVLGNQKKTHFHFWDPAEPTLAVQCSLILCRSTRYSDLVIMLHYPEALVIKHVERVGGCSIARTLNMHLRTETGLLWVSDVKDVFAGRHRFTVVGKRVRGEPGPKKGKERFVLPPPVNLGDID